MMLAQQPRSSFGSAASSGSNIPTAGFAGSRRPLLRSHRQCAPLHATTGCARRAHHPPRRTTIIPAAAAAAAPQTTLLRLTGLPRGTRADDLRAFVEQRQLQQLKGIFVMEADGEVVGCVDYHSQAAAAAAAEALAGAKFNGADISIHGAPAAVPAAATAAAAAAPVVAAAPAPKAAPGSTSTSTDSTTAAAADAPDSSTSSTTTTAAAEAPDSISRLATKAPRPSPRVVFFKRLPQGTTPEQLLELAGRAAGLERVSVVGKWRGSRTDGYARYESEEAAAAAAQALAGAQLQDGSAPAAVELHLAGVGSNSSSSSSGTSGASEGAAAAAADTAAQAPASDNGNGSSNGSSTNGYVASGAGAVRARLGGQGAWALKVSQLPWSTAEHELRGLFADCEGVEDAFLTLTSNGLPSGQGFVRFSSAAAVAAALEAKRGAELGGRALELSATRPGRIEAAPSADAAGAPKFTRGSTVADPLAGAAAQETRIILYGLPASFSYREVLGMCSVFGQVDQVKRMRAPGMAEVARGSSSSSSSEGGPDAVAAAAAAAAEPRKRQPAFVQMSKHAAAVEAALALNGRTVQGHLVSAHLYRVQPKRQPQEQEQGTKRATSKSPAAAVRGSGSGSKGRKMKKGAAAAAEGQEQPVVEEAVAVAAA